MNVTSSERNISILGYDCANERDGAYNLLIMLYEIYQIFWFIFCVSVVGTLYSLIGRKLYRTKSLQLYLRSTHAHLVTTRKFTFIMLSITIAFIVGHLPYLGLVVWRTISKQYDPNIFSNAEHAAFEIGVRSYFLGCVCNPIIYGLFNSKFRAFIKSVCHLQQEVQNSTDENKATWLKRNYVW